MRRRPTVRETRVLGMLTESDVRVMHRIALEDLGAI